MFAADVPRQLLPHLLDFHLSKDIQKMINEQDSRMSRQGPREDQPPLLLGIEWPAILQDVHRKAQPKLAEFVSQADRLTRLAKI